MEQFKHIAQSVLGPSFGVIQHLSKPSIDSSDDLLQSQCKVTVKALICVRCSVSQIPIEDSCVTRAFCAKMLCGSSTANRGLRTSVQ